jgi:hypothetical protein
MAETMLRVAGIRIVERAKHLHQTVQVRSGSPFLLCNEVGLASVCVCKLITAGEVFLLPRPMNASIQLDSILLTVTRFCLIREVKGELVALVCLTVIVLHGRVAIGLLITRRFYKSLVPARRLDN